MIAKCSLFTHRSAESVMSRQYFKVASRIRFELAELAFNFSVNTNSECPEFSNRVAAVFRAQYISLWELSLVDFVSFVRASRIAHRMEASLMVEQSLDTQNDLENSVTLCFKFYHWRKRVEFFGWLLVFSESGSVYRRVAYWTE